ncbi:MAG: cystathionine gamma-synthase [Gammaproteobacteria bacterium]|nr:cystathionine gamma-synthase [Gammaproteobacteria bacterium]
MTKHHACETSAVRAGVETDQQYGAVMPPLYLSSNFAFAGFDEPRAYDYTRSGNPTRDQLALALAELEGGAGAVITSSGMSALTLICQLLRPGDLVLAPHDCYGGTYRLLDSLRRRNCFNVEFIDQADQHLLVKLLAHKPKLILIETPSNPLLRIVDIEYICRLARQCGALTVADNTFLSPALQQPIRLGADMVVHSTTKYLNGHSDVVGGAVIANTPELHEELLWWANCLGLTGSPFDSFLTLRGLRTLHLRITHQQQNTLAVLEVLRKHPAVAEIYYPGLPGHPNHILAKRQQSGFGAMLSFDVRGGQAAARRFVEGLRYFSLAESLGGVESLVAHPASMTHAAMDPAARRRAGIGDGLIRLSIGAESPADLTEDIRAALDNLADRHVKYITR